MGIMTKTWREVIKLVLSWGDTDIDGVDTRQCSSPRWIIETSDECQHASMNEDKLLSLTNITNMLLKLIYITMFSILEDMVYVFSEFLSEGGTYLYAIFSTCSTQLYFYTIDYTYTHTWASTLFSMWLRRAMYEIILWIKCLQKANNIARGRTLTIICFVSYVLFTFACYDTNG
jgi:hypothetical protein